MSSRNSRSEVQKMTDAHTQEISKLGEHKEKEIMESGKLPKAVSQNALNRPPPFSNATD